MQIQTNTDTNIQGREGLANHVERVVEGAVGRFSDRISRVEVHLSDNNSDKSGQDDKRCVMEVRIEGRRPDAVSHTAATLHQAIDGAAEKLKRSIERTLERLHDRR